ncbi:MAG: glycerol-3-phosphate dehydrogenase/oxidase [Candidatus Lokiarchaeota archaeon]|nr:glycerol-3-phosphate dehydrogenase/oxidase [Candidatus Lokiarchaeota archaeon]
MGIANIFNTEWTYANRDKFIEKLKTEEFDLIVIGAGVTGAGVIREASLRGIKTALLDKNDFAFGTSSRSSKLAHGGLRYLNYAEFKLVHEACVERNWMRVDFPNLIRPDRFTMPGYKKGKDSVLKIWLALLLYDLMSEVGTKFKNRGKRKYISKKKTLQEEPNLNPNGLRMAGQYFDNHVDDARLTVEIIKESVATGYTTAVNYLEVCDYIVEDGKITGVHIVDNLTGTTFSILGKVFVNATGIWTDELLRNYPRKLIRPTKGVHVMVPKERVGNNHALVLRTIDDQRAYFVLDREKYTLIGTTDTDYTEDLDTPFCTKEDCDYLFRSVNHTFPNANLTYDDIISTYAGIRPLVREEGKSESQVSRKHALFETDDGLVTIAGGKLTTWRKMAEEVLYHIFKNNRLPKEIPKSELTKGYSMKPFLIGLEREDWDEFVKEKSPDLPSHTLDMLYQQYGKGAKRIIEYILQNPEVGKPFLEECYFIPAEIHYIMQYEFAPRLIDILCRRTEIAIKVKHTQQRIVAEQVADIMATYYNWNEETKSNELEHYMEYISKTIWF